MSNITGSINRILKKSFVDGPGNRAVVFLQGCNFNCHYCHNPYTINKCNNCGMCVSECPTGALSIKHDVVYWEETVCEECDNCIRICPYFSSPKVKVMTPMEVWSEIEAVSSFISGVSVSGGEPSLQVPFLVSFFELVKKNSNLTTLIETNGFVKPTAYDPLLPYLDMASVDLKASDPKKHLDLTGKQLAPVLETIHYLYNKGVLHSIQQVVVAGYTANDENIRQTAKILDKIDPNIPLKLLRFRPHGTKGKSLDWPSPSDEMMDHYATLAKENGLRNVTRSL